MNFEEPDLEELIQSDLHSEMNKILNQSDTEPCTSSDCIVTLNAIKQSSPTLGIPCDHEEVLCSNELFDISELPENHKQGSPVTFLHHCSADTGTTQSLIKSEVQHAEFSGHFSVESYSSSMANEASSTECTDIKLEHNDLSNLAWLTSVDVQQALQRIPHTEGAFPNNQQSMHLTSQNSPALLENSTNSHVPSHAMFSRERTTPRFTPIQPNLNNDGDMQRYVLQQRGQRTLMPMSEQHQYGHHVSYHSYPPPPYGNSSRYMHEGYPQGRYPNQAQKVFPKPVYSYSCLIAMSLRNSKSGCLPVSDIYSFMMENFPYFKTAPDGWKNSVRHNLSLNKCFEKVEKPNGSQRKGCLWALNPAKIGKMEEEVQKWKRKDPEAIRKSMSNPEELDRELEEIRRSDEEAARRRMLSMATHGLSMITSQHGFHPYSRQNQHYNSPHSRHLHPGGTSSLPTTPQHYHQHSTPYRHSMTPTQRLSSNDTSVYSGYNGEHNHSGQPRQLFKYPVENQNLALGAPEVSNTPNTNFKNGEPQNPNMTSQLKQPSVSSLYSPSSSSGNASFLGSLADTIANSGQDLNSIDLDSSLADLSALQGSLWDDSGPVLTPQDQFVDPSMRADSFDDSGGQNNHPHPNLHTSSMNMIDRVTDTGETTADQDVFAATTRFGGDISYFSSNSKTVMLH